jgi:hypothetical protein
VLKLMMFRCPVDEFGVDMEPSRFILSVLMERAESNNSHRPRYNKDEEYKRYFAQQKALVGPNRKNEGGGRDFR